MSESESVPSELPVETPSRRVKRRVPPRRFWIIVAVLVVVVGTVRATGIAYDYGLVNNIVTWVAGFIGLVSLAVWFFFRSAYSRLTRLLVFGGCVVMQAVFFAVFRLERVDGELSPIFAYRFSAVPDRLLDSNPANVGKVDLRTTTKDDFPEFLGRNRTEAVDDVSLARDWTKHPPKLVWKQKIGAGWSAFSVVNGHAVTMEQRGDMEMTTCYAVETGRLEWSYSTLGRFERLEAGAGPRSTPTIDEGMVYAVGALGHFACLDGATGKPVWEKDLLNEFGIPREEDAEAVLWGRSNSPLIVGNKVIVPIGGCKGKRMVSLAAFDKRSGARLWEGGQCQISYCSPTLATLGGVEQILIVNEETASGHDVATGSVLWECSRPGHTNRDPNVSQAVPVAPNQVFFSKGYGGGATLVRLNPKGDGKFSAETVWASPRVMKTKFTNVAMRDGYAYGLSDGILECVEVAGGASKWKQGRYGHGQILRVGDLLLVLTEQGEVVLVEATPDRTNSVLGRFQAIEGLTWNNLALYGPYLLVRNAEEAACYKLPLAEKR
jgi:outer membrane protein assembly factor BamB